MFAITQVTGLLSADPSWDGLARGLLVLGALWWAWVAYAWLTNTLDPEEELVRLAMLAAMAAMLLVALSVPLAFGKDAALFGVAYLLVRLLHVLLYALGAKRDPDLLGAVFRLAPTAIAGPSLIIAAAFFDGTMQGALWVGALVVDYVGPALGRGRGWRVSPGHFAERHGLIVIIALGESIVALGVGAGTLELDAGAIVAAVLGIVVISALWWAYFDWFALVGERVLTRADGLARATLARDVYSYLHLAFVAGIVLFALGLKKTLGDASAELETVPAVGLCGGLSLYFAGHVAVRFRLNGSIGVGRATAALVLLGLLPVALAVPALAALALVAAACAGLIVYEVVRFREDRARIRHEGALPQPRAT
ncbi:MAG: low temperature requirement protein A [Actinomycetota bacterium]|nr:low temperature requirement protein A [Actinomycetota bacterium]